MGRKGLKEDFHMGGVDLDGRIILKWILMDSA
jgi:hypothetical protein